jgi:vancomycin resistance protein YoaR
MSKSKKDKITQDKIKGRFSNIIFVLLGFIVITFFIFTLILNVYFLNRTYPNTSIVGIPVGGLIKDQVIKKLESNVKIPSNIFINTNGEEIKLDPGTINFSYDFQRSADESIFIHRKKYLFAQLLLINRDMLSKKEMPLLFNFDEGKLDEFINILDSEYSKLPSDYSIGLKNGVVFVDKGQPGKTVDKGLLKNKILESFSQNQFPDLELGFVINDSVLSDQDVDSIKSRSLKLLNKNLTLTYEYQTFNLSDALLLNFLYKDGGYNDKKISKYIDENIKPALEIAPQNASFVFKDQKVEEFSPAKKGVKVDTESLVKDIINKIKNLEETNIKTESLLIAVSTTDPEITLDDVNNFGINELIGRGYSLFKGSIPSRIYNIGHAAAKFNSILVAPNETFSFDKILGDVSALTGYKQAYIIQNGRTVLGDGGGVCQVSTTLFRAVLNAGLPVIERRAHSYRVGYYEQGSPPGIDATVYYPTTDFKFKNDTPGYLLIQTIFDAKSASLIFEIYGTSDGRSITLSKPIISNVTAPPEDLYIDDPTLPSGQVKQIDHKAWGAKVTFNYKVERSGETLIDKNFISNYQPWQSVFLRGTGPSN